MSNSRLSDIRLLDLACGRGGDINKWLDCPISYVKGVDFAPKEIEEANKRWEETKRRNRASRLKIEFVVYDQLGINDQPFLPQFEVVTCMFAVHYFFSTELSAKTFFKTVSDSLVDGGYFMGTFPEGKSILLLLEQKEKYESKLLTIEKKWKGKEQCFGSPFLFSIGDTVTEGKSLEYLVFFNVFIGIASQFNLFPVSDWGNEDIDRLFKFEDKKETFKHFKPDFRNSDISLSKASALNVAFVFQKRENQSQKRPASVPVDVSNQTKRQKTDS